MISSARMHGLNPDARLTCKLQISRPAANRLKPKSGRANYMFMSVILYNYRPKTGKFANFAPVRHNDNVRAANKRRVAFKK